MRSCPIIAIVLLCSICLAWAKEVPKPVKGELYADAEVRRIAKVFRVDSIVMKGSLLALSKENGLALGGGKWGSIDEVLNRIGLEVRRVELIEGLTANGWGVARYQASPSFDVVVSCFVRISKDKANELTVDSIFLIPHSGKDFGVKLFNGKRWEEIVFR